MKVEARDLIEIDSFFPNSVQITMSYVYLKNLLNMIQYMRAVYNRILAGISEPHEDSWLHDTVNVYDTKIGLDLVHDELYIPPGVVQPPFFHEKLPAAINFAGIGSMLASALARLIGESGRSYNSQFMYT